MSYFEWLFLQVQTVEDDLETDFYKDLIPLGNNNNQQALGNHEYSVSSGIPILFSSKQKESRTSMSSFKQAVEASHKKVKKIPHPLTLPGN